MSRPPERGIPVEQLPNWRTDSLVTGGVRLDDGTEDRLGLVGNGELREIRLDSSAHAYERLEICNVNRGHTHVGSPSARRVALLVSA